MIRGLIFDWGGVLIDNPADSLMAYCAGKLEIKVGQLKNIFAQYEVAFQTNQISELEFWQIVSQTLNVSLPKTKSLWKEAVAHVFADKPEMYLLINQLRQVGYKTALLSNTELPTTEYFFENGYDQYFDAITFSCLDHVVKPKPAIYQLTLQKLDLKPEQTIFIDDRQINIDGANKVGLNTILFQDYTQLIRDLATYSIKLKLQPKSIY